MSKKYSIEGAMDIIANLRSSGLLNEKQESSNWVLYHGSYGKWNVKIYRDKFNRCSIVTNDEHTMEKILSGENPFVSNKTRIIYIDDAGWGCPLGGVLIGAYDSETRKFIYEEVDVAHFQGYEFETQRYLDEATNSTEHLIDEFGCKPDNTLIKICTGYINTKSKDRMRERGYEVQVIEIKDPLQSLIENTFKNYLQKLGLDFADIEDYTKSFFKAIDWIKQDKENRVKLAKSGWGFGETLEKWLR